MGTWPTQRVNATQHRHANARLVELDKKLDGKDCDLTPAELIEYRDLALVFMESYSRILCGAAPLVAASRPSVLAALVGATA